MISRVTVNTYLKSCLKFPQKFAAMPYMKQKNFSYLKHWRWEQWILTVFWDVTPPRIRQSSKYSSRVFFSCKCDCMYIFPGDSTGHAMAPFLLCMGKV